MTKFRFLPYTEKQLEYLNSKEYLADDSTLKSVTEIYVRCIREGLPSPIKVMVFIYRDGYRFTLGSDVPSSNTELIVDDIVGNVWIPNKDHEIFRYTTPEMLNLVCRLNVELYNPYFNLHNTISTDPIEFIHVEGGFILVNWKSSSESRKRSIPISNIDSIKETIETRSTLIQ